MEFDERSFWIFIGWAMFGSEVLYETVAVSMFAASVVWIPSQNLYWLLFWHGVRLGRQTPLVVFNWQQAASVIVKPEIDQS